MILHINNVTKHKHLILKSKGRNYKLRNLNMLDIRENYNQLKKNKPKIFHYKRSNHIQTPNKYQQNSSHASQRRTPMLSSNHADYKNHACQWRHDKNVQDTSRRNKAAKASFFSILPLAHFLPSLFLTL